MLYALLALFFCCGFLVIGLLIIYTVSLYIFCSPVLSIFYDRTMAGVWLRLWNLIPNDSGPSYHYDYNRVRVNGIDEEADLEDNYEESIEEIEERKKITFIARPPLVEDIFQLTGIIRTNSSLAELNSNSNNNNNNNSGNNPNSNSNSGGGIYDFFRQTSYGSVDTSVDYESQPPSSVSPLGGRVSPSLKELQYPLAHVDSLQLQTEFLNKDRERTSSLSAAAIQLIEEDPLSYIYKGPQFGDRWFPVYIFMNTLLILWIASPAILGIVRDYNANIDWIFFSMLLVAAITGIFSILTLLAISTSELIHHLYWIGITTNALIAVVSLFYGNIKGFIINLLIAIAISYNYWQSQKDIPFARAMLKTCTGCFRDNAYGLFFVAAAAVIVNLTWVTIWAIATNQILGFIHNISDSRDRKPINFFYGDNHIEGADTSNPIVMVVLFILFTNLITGISCIRAISETIAAGTVAAWWFSPDSPYPVRGAVYRACTTQLGTVCFGSLAVPLCCTASDILNVLDSTLVPLFLLDGGPFISLRNSLAEGISSLTAILDKHCESLNRFCVVMVAAKSLPLRAAGQASTHILKQRGWGTLAKDAMVSRVMGFGELLIVVFGIVAGLLISRALASSLAEATTDDIDDIIIEEGMRPSVALMICGGLLGFSVGHTVTCTFGAGVSTVLLMLAHDGGVNLKQARPRRYKILARAWHVAHPGALKSPSNNLLKSNDLLLLNDEYGEEN